MNIDLMFHQNIDELDNYILRLYDRGYVVMPIRLIIDTFDCNIREAKEYRDDLIAKRNKEVPNA